MNNLRYPEMDIYARPLKKFRKNTSFDVESRKAYARILKSYKTKDLSLMLYKKRTLRGSSPLLSMIDKHSWQQRLVYHITPTLPMG